MICPTCQGMPHRRGRGCARCDDTGRIEAPEVTELRGLTDAQRVSRDRIDRAMSRHSDIIGAERRHVAGILARGLVHSADPVRCVMTWARVDAERAGAILGAVGSAA